MAVKAITVTIGATGADGNPLSTSIANKGDPAALATTADTDADAAVTAEVDYTDVDDAVGVLVADGASPTQAHVDDLNTAWGLLKTAIDALHTAVDLVKTDTAATLTSVTGDMIVAIDTATVDTKNKANTALRAASKALESGYSGLTS